MDIADTKHSAPELVAELEARWQPIANHDREQLAFKWIDRSVRVMLAEGFAKAGHARLAERLEQMGRVCDAATLIEMDNSLAELDFPEGPIEVMASLFDVRATLGN